MWTWCQLKKKKKQLTFYKMSLLESWASNDQAGDRRQILFISIFLRATWYNQAWQSTRVQTQRIPGQLSVAPCTLSSQFNQSFPVRCCPKAHANQLHMGLERLTHGWSLGLHVYHPQEDANKLLVAKMSSLQAEGKDIHKICKQAGSISAVLTLPWLEYGGMLWKKTQVWSAYEGTVMKKRIEKHYPRSRKKTRKNPFFLRDG